MTPLSVIDGYAVDVEALMRLAHRCDPGRCRRRASCCACFEITVAPRRAEALTGLIPAAGRFAPGLFEDGRLINPFDPIENNRLAIDTDDDGLCAFAFRDAAGRTLCSLHAAAVEIGLPPHLHKPASCWLWPLAVSEDDPPVLTVHEGATAFPCNRSRRPGRTLHPGVRGILQPVLGAEFVRAVEASCRR